jgi:hypothetical protein
MVAQKPEGNVMPPFAESHTTFSFGSVMLSLHAASITAMAATLRRMEVLGREYMTRSQ